MQRINLIDESTAPNKTIELLAAVRKQMGGVPNILATMAQSSATLGGYLGLASALAGGKLTAKLREQIALAVAGANGCDYCASVHAVLGSQVGVGSDEVSSNLNGQSSDHKTQAALQFARQIVATRG
ncbi:MAG: carboxymuconolactone decarboxylase family protein, partial [Gammaproteobacteria bacterium]|nr:carboxymuconolactone decarboxylase family protein [Gammaproteobacteria bacterium]